MVHGEETVQRLAIDAHATANRAQVAIVAHEKICSERYDDINRKLDHISQSVDNTRSKEDTRWDRYNNSVRSLALTIIVVMLGAFGSVAMLMYYDMRDDIQSTAEYQESRQP